VKLFRIVDAHGAHVFTNKSNGFYHSEESAKNGIRGIKGVHWRVSRFTLPLRVQEADVQWREVRSDEALPNIG